MNTHATGLTTALLLTVATGLVSAAEPAASASYARPYEPPTRPAFIALPPVAVEPQGWLRDWCLTARDGYTGHMDDVAVAFKQAWAADYKMTGDRLFWPNGGWPYEGGGYWFDGLVRLGYALHDESLVDQARARLGAVINNISDKGFSFLWWLDRNNPADIKAVEGKHHSDSYWPLWANGLFGRRWRRTAPPRRTRGPSPRWKPPTAAGPSGSACPGACPMPGPPSRRTPGPGDRRSRRRSRSCTRAR